MFGENCFCISSWFNLFLWANFLSHESSTGSTSKSSNTRTFRKLFKAHSNTLCSQHCGISKDHARTRVPLLIKTLKHFLRNSSFFSTLLLFINFDIIVDYKIKYSVNKYIDFDCYKI